VKEPHSAFETKVARSKGAYGTNVYDVTRIRVVKRAVLEGPDRNVIAAPKKLHLAGFSHVVEESYAA